MARELFSMSPPRVLTIAGSDTSGGAGIQADLKTFASLGAYGMSVITSLTAQNTCGVRAIHTPPGDFVETQLNALSDDVDIDSIKIGMLSNKDVIESISKDAIDRVQNKAPHGAPIVLDPVMVSTAGSLLLEQDAISSLIDTLIPRTFILTPNLPEAHELLIQCGTRSRNETWDSFENIILAACKLTSMGCHCVLLKGGHLALRNTEVEEILNTMELQNYNVKPYEFEGACVFSCKWRCYDVLIVRLDKEPYAKILEDESDLDKRVVVDVLYQSAAKHLTIFTKPKVNSGATHGTGCTLSSALAVELAALENTQRNKPVVLAIAVFRSIQYVQRCISRGIEDLGKGPGPLHHLCVTMPRLVLPPSSFPGGGQRTPLCSRLIAHSLPLWERYTKHPFVAKMIDESLSEDAFIYFLKQDYHFLQHYARVWASGASSFTIGKTFSRIHTLSNMAAEMAAEAQNHVAICREWGISVEELEQTSESAATVAYTRFVLDVSRSGDILELLAATGPCVLGYGEAGLWVSQERSSRECQSEGLRKWVGYYAGEDFQRVVRNGIQDMEQFSHADPPSPSRLKNLQRIWDGYVIMEES